MEKIKKFHVDLLYIRYLWFSLSCIFDFLYKNKVGKMVLPPPPSKKKNNEEAKLAKKTNSGMNGGKPT